MTVRLQPEPGNLPPRRRPFSEEGTPGNPGLRRDRPGRAAARIPLRGRPERGPAEARPLFSEVAAGKTRGTPGVSLLLSCLVLLLLFPSPRPAEAARGVPPAPDASDRAVGFAVEPHRGGGWVLRNRQPWQGAREEESWLLLPPGRAAEPDFPVHRTVRVPARRIVVLGISSVSALERLGALDRVVAIGGLPYLYSPVARGLRLPDVGPGGGMGVDVDLEKILALRPDLVIAYAYTREERVRIARLEELGIPVVLVSEYLENSPLGRAEWIRFIARLVGREDRAEALFRQVARHYREIRARVADRRDRPLVLTGAPFQGTWYAGGGKSWLARLIVDAGGRYFAADLPGEGSVPLAAEAVFQRGGKTEFWVNCGLWRSRNEIRGSDPRFALLPPFRGNRIYNNDARRNGTGGNDYYEGGVWRPDQVLEDLASIFHPNLFPGYRPVYYRRLPEESSR